MDCHVACAPRNDGSLDRRIGRRAPSHRIVSLRGRSNHLIWRAFHQSFHIAGNKFNSVVIVS
jgi:hypothetical protein